MCGTPAEACVFVAAGINARPVPGSATAQRGAGHRWGGAAPCFALTRLRVEGNGPITKLVHLGFFIVEVTRVSRQ